MILFYSIIFAILTLLVFFLMILFAITYCWPGDPMEVIDSFIRSLAEEKPKPNKKATKHKVNILA